MPKKKWLYGFGRAVCMPVLKLLYRYRFTNKDNLPETGSYIICANHQSYADPVLIGIGQKRQIRYMAKDQLFRHKLLGRLISALGAFPVMRDSHDNAQAFETADSVLEDGGILGIFPEGTRSKTGELLRMRSGAALIAAQMMVPVVPACITAKGGKMKLFNPVKITYGDPITPEQLGLTENAQGHQIRNASRVIADAITKIREQDKF